MTLGTHIIVATAVSKAIIPTGNIPLIFGVSLASHYLVDAIPHFDYESSMLKKDEINPMIIRTNFSPKLAIKDFTKFGFDLFLGLIILYLSVKNNLQITGITPYVAIIIGGTLPDLLQFLCAIYKKPPLTYFQKFHDFWHSKLRLKATPSAIASQIAIVALSVFLITR